MPEESDSPREQDLGVGDKTGRGSQQSHVSVDIENPTIFPELHRHELRFERVTIVVFRHQKRIERFRPRGSSKPCP